MDRLRLLTLGLLCIVLSPLAIVAAVMAGLVSIGVALMGSTPDEHYRHF